MPEIVDDVPPEIRNEPLPDDGLITVTYTETTRIKTQITPELARQVFGLGGTPDDEVGRRVAAIVHHSPTLLARLGPHADAETAISWSLVKMLDPYDIDTYL